MKTRNRWTAALGMALGLACWAGPAHATGAGTDSVTVTISPLAQYLLQVTTGAPAGGLALGSVGILTSTYTVNPTTVTVYSSYPTTGIELEGLVAGGWGMEPQTTALSTDTNKMAVWAVFTDTGMASQPQASGAAL